MDFIEGLPISDGCNVIMVVVDRFSKYAHFIPLCHLFTAQKVAKAFMDNVVKLDGVPLTIVSDRDKIFTSAFWKDLFAALDTKLLFSTAYHPQTDGQTERVNQCLEMYLRCTVQESPRKWRAQLPHAEFWYNTNFHSSLGCSPFRALYGREPNFGAMPLLSSSGSASLEELLQERQCHAERLRQHLVAAQDRMKAQADRNRTDKQYQVGEQVLLKLQPYAQVSLVNRPFPKLAYKFFGPYKILDRIGAAAYRLDLPEESLIHPVFHVSQLKPFTPDFTPVYSELPKIAELDRGMLIPEENLDRRLVKKGNAAIPQCLIKWTGIPAASATWEDYNVVKARFPQAIAWGQASSGGGGGVTPTVFTTGTGDGTENGEVIL